MTHPSREFLEFQAALAGEYSIQRELGRGGMGIVYLARDVQLDRDVAIKVLPVELSSIAARERFLREARTAASLSHPNIVPIHRVGEAGGFVFFVMTYVEGETLGERLRARGPLPPAEASRVLREVAWAIAYAHSRGIVHRDNKPDNILLETGTGRALVTDFGIAHVGASHAGDTDPGMVMGTAHFMSPEQAANEPLDGRSDIYALGVVGYLAVSGRLPFEASNLPALMVRRASETPFRVHRAAPGLPSAMGVAIHRCLARSPNDRFPDGEALAAALAPAPESRPAMPPALRDHARDRSPGAERRRSARAQGQRGNEPPLAAANHDSCRNVARGHHRLCHHRFRQRAADSAGIHIGADVDDLAARCGEQRAGRVVHSDEGCDWWQNGIRNRLWKSRAGEWLAKELGAPASSRAVSASAFRATESALGAAAADLYAALPKAYRDQLAELPATVAALEARAAEARAELDTVGALAPSGRTTQACWSRAARPRRGDSWRASRHWKDFGSICCDCMQARAISPRSRR